VSKSDIVLCDERPQGIDGDVDAAVAGPAAAVGVPAGGRGAGAGRLAGGADPALRQAGLPVRGARAARPVRLLLAASAGAWPGQVRAGVVGDAGAGLPATRQRYRGGARADLGDQRRTAGPAGAVVP